MISGLYTQPHTSTLSWKIYSSGLQTTPIFRNPPQRTTPECPPLTNKQPTNCYHHHLSTSTPPRSKTYTTQDDRDSRLDPFPPHPPSMGKRIRNPRSSSSLNYLMG